MLCQSNTRHDGTAGCAYGQKQGKVRVVLVLMKEIGEPGWLRHWGGGDRVQIGDDRFGVGVDARANGQSGESGSGVELEEAGLKVPAVQEIDSLDFNVDAELGTEGAISQSEYAGYVSPHEKTLTQRSRQRQPRQSGRKCRELAIGKRDYEESDRGPEAN